MSWLFQSIFFQVELGFRMRVSGREKTRGPGEKILYARTRINNKLNPGLANFLAYHIFLSGQIEKMAS